MLLILCMIEERRRSSKAVEDGGKRVLYKQTRDVIINRKDIIT